MNIIDKIRNIDRYNELALLIVKYGRAELVQQAGLGDILGGDLQSTSAKAEEFTADLERLGSTYVKLGQLLSTRADLLSTEFLEALERLQDDVSPFPYEKVDEIVSEELGVKISKAFSEFEKDPIAAASIGQVHKARLRDGSRVVVKVQRPDLRLEVRKDLEVIGDISELLDEKTEFGKRYEFRNTLIELKKSLLRELDFLREASALITLNKNLEEFENLKVPLPVEDYTTSRVLTMEHIDGRKITDIGPLGLMDLDGQNLANELFHGYLQNILVDGFFHADPHPGNIFVTDDAKIALIDLGMTGYLTAGFRENLLNLLLAISEGRGEDAVRTALKIGEKKNNFESASFKREITDLIISNRKSGLEKLETGRIVIEITKISAECGFRPPPEFTLVAKTLLNLDKSVKTLDPEFNPNESLRRHVVEIVGGQVVESVSPGSKMATAIELKQLLENVPPSLNKILETVANNELKLNVDAIDEKTLMSGFQKVANRIAMGLVLAALIIGASMLMNIESTITFLGYPVLALMLFLAAVAGGILMIYSILFNDLDTE